MRIPVLFFALVTAASPLVAQLSPWSLPGTTGLASSGVAQCTPLTAESGFQLGGLGGHRPVNCVSADGRFVVFVTLEQIVPNDLNTEVDVYIRDRQLGTTTLVSQEGGVAVGGRYPALSEDGKYVVYVKNDSVGHPRHDIFRWSRESGTDVLVTSTSVIPEQFCSLVAVGFGLTSISANGKVIAAEMAFIGGGGAFGMKIIAVAECSPGVFSATIASRTITAPPGLCPSLSELCTLGEPIENAANGAEPVVSGDGNVIIYATTYQDIYEATGTPIDSTRQLFAFHIPSRTTSLVSKGNDENPVSTGIGLGYDLSFRGNHIVFCSNADNLDNVCGLGTCQLNVFAVNTGLDAPPVRLTTGVAFNDVCEWPSVSGSGRFVSYETSSVQQLNGGPPDTNSARDVFVLDRDPDGNGQFVPPYERYRISLRDDETQAGGGGFLSWLADNGLNVAFLSQDKMGVACMPGDPNELTVRNVFVRDAAQP